MLTVPRRTQFALKEVGEIVTGNPMRSEFSMGASLNPHPMVLIRNEGSIWWAVGLTSRARTSSGITRTEVPNPDSLGLNKKTYLHRRHLQRVSVVDIDIHIGFASPQLILTLAEHAELSSEDVLSLCASLD